MNGHDLTFVTLGSARGNQVLCGLQVKNPGNILADHTQMYFSASKTWEGTAANTIVLTNNPYFRMYNFGGQIKWTLVNADEGLIGYSQAGSSFSPEGLSAKRWHLETGTAEDGSATISLNWRNGLSIQLR